MMTTALLIQGLRQIIDLVSSVLPGASGGDSMMDVLGLLQAMVPEDALPTSKSNSDFSREFSFFWAFLQALVAPDHTY